jgi:formylglycine-generating enzyme required for sulfatase activity/serine/threonine protein kinase
MDPMDVPGGSTIDPVERILAECLAIPERDREQAIEEACARSPELADALRARVDALHALGIDSAAPRLDYPERLGDFRLIERLGGGGMGVVFLAEQVSLKREVALKLIRPEQVFFEGSRARFRREAEAVARLQHPGIVPIFAVGEEQGIPYFAMERVRGCTLAHALRALRDRAPESLEGADLHAIVAGAAGVAAPTVEGSIFQGSWIEACLGIARQVAEALDHAHARGLVHRDVKPSNIALTPDGRAMLLDFGLARADGAHELTRTGSAIGTLHYMSPEHLRGGKEVREASDVYSLGVTLYEMLALQVPYRGESTLEIERLVLEGRPDPLRARNRRVEADLETVVLCAIDRDRSRRYRRAADFARDLGHLLARRPIEARRPGALLRTRRWTQRHPAAATAIVLGPALVLGAGIAILAREKSHSRALGETLEETRKARDEARLEKANVLRLSAFQTLAKLEQEADDLWPAVPEKLPAMRAWIDRAQALVDGLPEHLATLAEIRSRARPRTEEQVEADRRASSFFAEWEKQSARLTWLRRMFHVEPWPAESDVEAALAKEDLPSDANGLNALAWPLVEPGPEKSRYGGEIRALVLARRAVALATDAERPGMRDTLAHALFRCGRFEEALAEARRAFDEGGGAEHQELSGSLDWIRLTVDSWDPTSAVSLYAGYRKDMERLPGQIAVLDEDVSERRTWEFDDEQDTWWHAELSKLVAELREFQSVERGGLLSTGVSDPHGWGVPRRAEFASEILRRSVEGAEAQAQWKAATAANARYDGLALAPELGLLPIGEDPDSHLLEFAHLATGDPAERGSDGRLVLKEETGLVFVLLPGGTFRMGAQSADPSAPNYDAQAAANESPVREITLAPFFLSKYEMTQGQWERCTGKNPSTYNPGTVANGKYLSRLHPVEEVSWTDAMRILSRLGLVLPTEAQWEYGARAGTSTPWWTGTEKESLRGAVNLRDGYAQVHGLGVSTSAETWLDDGYTAHAPVGSFRANGFGLHDTAGNLWELCREPFGRYDLPVREGDGERIGTTQTSRMIRGSSYFAGSVSARSAARFDVTPDYRDFSIGLRPARALTRP